jgi:Fur family ferric uptake transcriptional regulator
MNINSFLLEFRKYLKSRSLPFTPERETAIALISETEDHFTIEELLSEILNKNLQVSRATLYRTVQLLLDAGLITKISRDDKPPLYESILDRKPHNHFLCNICGRIIEFQSPGIEDNIKKISQENSFQVDTHSLKIFGYCSECTKKTDIPED